MPPKRKAVGGKTDPKKKKEIECHTSDLDNNDGEDRTNRKLHSKKKSQEVKRSPKAAKGDPKPKTGGRARDPVKSLDVPKPDPELLSPVKSQQPLPKRLDNGDLVFKDFPDFIPNMTPKEVLHAGSFGGTYFRDIYSSVLGEKCKDAWKELPEDWLQGLDINKQVSSQTYNESVNKYKAKCGGDLEMWETSGWIKKQDPYGWFQWYCRFYQGRRSKDDERQISRWAKCAGVRGRWRSNLVTKIYKANARLDDSSISPVVRQVLLHWAYTLTQSHYDVGVKAVIKRLAGKK